MSLKSCYCSAICLWLSLVCLACTKPINLVPQTAAVSDQDIVTNILADYCSHVATPMYVDLALRANQLEASLIVLDSARTTQNLEAAQQNWRALRLVWERSEAFLFGPVETDNIDAGIDTWPVNKADFDSLLSVSTPITATWLESQQESIKGFHPLEYIIFGSGGTRKPEELTPRMRAYMLALGSYLTSKCSFMQQTYDTNLPGNFAVQVAAAGTPNSTTYGSQYAAMEEILGAMAGICDEVGSSKIQEPLAAQDPRLEESPFSKNSMVDFTNNIIGVSHVYLCNYKGEGTSISTLVQRYNKALDGRIRQQLNQTVGLMSTVNIPFSEAIFSQRTQLNNVQQSIEALNKTLENDLKPLLLSKCKR